MKNSIEEIWKEGFLNEKSLVAPKINDLYNRKSKHVVEKVTRMFRINLIVIIIMAVVLPVVHYFLDATWQGTAASILLFLTAWYNKRLIHSIKKLDHGVTSLQYLKSFDRWLKDVLSRSERIGRFSYPLYFLIALSTIWSTWIKQQQLVLETQPKFGHFIFVGNLALIALILSAVATLLVLYFSDRIFKWDVRLMYGRVFRKLEETIAEMEQLRKE